MSLQDSAVIFFLALLLFGPRKLPELARQLGKLMGEFRRASNEFRMQMEDELRVIEQEDRQKKIAAIEAAAPPQVTPEPTPASLPEPAAALPEPGAAATNLPASATPAITVTEHTIAPPPHFYDRTDAAAATPEPAPAVQPAPEPVQPAPEPVQPAPEPVPIATSGSLRMMPPASGLPVARSANAGVSDAFDSIPEAPNHSTTPEVTNHA